MGGVLCVGIVGYFGAEYPHMGEVIMDNPFTIIDERLANIEKCLAKIMSVISENPQPALASIDEVKLSIDELAHYLNKDKSTIHRYKKNGVFPCYQAGRTVYFKKEEVDTALSRRRK